MEMYESLLAIYNKRNGYYSQHMNQCEIEEHDANATFHHLYIYNRGALLNKFDTDYVKDFKNTTEKITAVLKDSKCDGVVFIKGNDGRIHLVFSELKSKCTSTNLEKAFNQVIFTFFKYHQLLSICKNYNLSDTTMDFVLACNVGDVDDDAEIYSDMQNEQMILSEVRTKSFVADMLPSLLRDKVISFKIGELRQFQSLPFSDGIINKTITLHLATSISQTSDTASITFNY